MLFPIDVVKSVIQKESMRLPEPRFKKGWDFVKYAYKRDGLKRFYNGITPQLIRAFPVHALSFVIFEDVLKRLQL